MFTHLENVYRKLGAHGRTRALAWARELRLLRLHYCCGELLVPSVPQSFFGVAPQGRAPAVDGHDGAV